MWGKYMWGSKNPGMTVISWVRQTNQRKGAICLPANFRFQPLDSKNILRWSDTAKYFITPTPVDPAGGHCYWNPIKTCESRDFGSRRTAQ